MALVKCPECGNEVSNRVPACIYCGCPLSEAALAKSAPKVTTLTPNSGEGSPKNHWQRKKKSNKPILILSILTVVLLVIGINVFSSLKCEHEWSDATCSFPKSCIINPARRYAYDDQRFPKKASPHDIFELFRQPQRLVCRGYAVRLSDCGH